MVAVGCGSFHSLGILLGIYKLKDVEADQLNEEYDFFKSLCYALGHNADFNACAIVNMPGYYVGKNFMFNLTREELITLVNNRRTKIHEQLNGI